MEKKFCEFEIYEKCLNKIMIIVRYLVIGRGLLWYKNVYSWSILFIRYILVCICIYNEYGLNSR